MALRLFRYTFVAVLFVSLGSLVHAGVLQLAPVSEVGVAQDLGVSKDAATWVGEDGIQGECFAASGAVLSDEGAAEVDEESADVDAVEAIFASVSVLSRASGAMESTNTVPINQPGDVNGDGYVNQSDVNIIASNWQHGTTGTPDATKDMGDLNGDGKVDGSDVTILAYHWGAKPIEVPEASTVLLLVSGAIGLILSRRFRRA